MLTKILDALLSILAAKDNSMVAIPVGDCRSYWINCNNRASLNEMRETGFPYNKN